MPLCVEQEFGSLVFEFLFSYTDLYKQSVRHNAHVEKKVVSVCTSYFYPAKPTVYVSPRKKMAKCKPCGGPPSGFHPAQTHKTVRDINRRVGSCCLFVVVHRLLDM